MSFSFDAKNELCKLSVQKACCARAEAYGILLYCNTFHPGEVRIVTENPNFAARLPRIFHRAFHVQFDRRPDPVPQPSAPPPDRGMAAGDGPGQSAATPYSAPRRGSERPAPQGARPFEAAPGQGGGAGLERAGGPPAAPPGKLVFQITERQKLDHITDALGYAPARNLVLHINFGLLEEDCCRASFLRGVFFAGGSVTDPLKRYHLELATSHLQVSRELGALLRDGGFPPKAVSRNGSYITYFKQSDQIEDFLTLVGAPVAAMDVMSAKLEKDLRNSVNRRINCDNANLDKAVDAAQEQIEAIRRLTASGLLERLPDKLRETAAARLESPELSLSELADGFEPPITKSCLNHRLRKLMELAGKR